MAEDFKKAATKIIKRLKAHDFTIQRYNAYSSKSVYLKLDYGVCYSIRISDHHGKAHLKYRFNIGSHITEPMVVNDGGFVRYFFPIDQVDELMACILKEREAKIQKYSKYAYKKFLQKNLEDNKGKQGFWKSATLV